MKRNAGVCAVFMSVLLTACGGSEKSATVYPAQVIFQSISAEITPDSVSVTQPQYFAGNDRQVVKLERHTLMDSHGNQAQTVEICNGTLVTICKKQLQLDGSIADNTSVYVSVNHELWQQQTASLTIDVFPTLNSPLDDEVYNAGESINLLWDDQNNESATGFYLSGCGYSLSGEPYGEFFELESGVKSYALDTADISNLPCTLVIRLQKELSGHISSAFAGGSFIASIVSAPRSVIIQ
ncbi:hypothetical protein ACQUQU_09920 [Thalassolituus sp. LLYu03]|uniref:hypothetical protein n=1 Tax=Thalassolituus sp. LLYu03 TaxID=3421656 RepID=UPI003D2D8004